MPNTTVIGSQLYQLDLEFLVTETVELVATCEPGADYQSV
jgi:hypothetical protein